MAMTAKEKERKARGLRILDALVERFPDARCELDHDGPWQLLVAVVLSAQATDVSVNKVTPALFAAFPSVLHFAAADADDVEPFIKSIGLFRNKAKNVVGAARQIVAMHGGVVPADRAHLEALPGVGAKSAAVLIANCFGVPAIAVDTHVGRVSRRLGLTRQTDPNKVEADLTALWPRARLLQAHHTLIFQGRRICDARKPHCSACPVSAECKKVGVDVWI
ncbi:MAG: endonuclease III [Deltaproteobacteria bacterium]|nr:endonuclease III [Deltaproteobacteria bacterium]